MLHVTTVSGHVFGVKMLYGASDLQSGGEIGTLHLENRQFTPEYWYLSHEKQMVSATRRRRTNVMQQQCKTVFATNVVVTMKVSVLPEKMTLWKQACKTFSAPSCMQRRMCNRLNINPCCTLLQSQDMFSESKCCMVRQTYKAVGR